MNTFIVSFDISSKHDSDRKALNKHLVDGTILSKVLIEEELESIIVKNSTLLSCKPTKNLYLFETEMTSKNLKDKFSNYIDEKMDTVFIMNICNPKNDTLYYGSGYGDRPEITHCSIFQILNRLQLIRE